MQRSQIRPQARPATTTQRPGPVPLDPKHLQFVAGGAPRGGWAPTDSTTTLAPRGGWL